MAGRRDTVGNRIWSLVTGSKSTGGDKHTQMQIPVAQGQELHTHNRVMNIALLMMNSNKGTENPHSSLHYRGAVEKATILFPSLRLPVPTVKRSQL